MHFFYKPSSFLKNRHLFYKPSSLFLAIKVGERREIAVLTKSAGKSDGPAKVTLNTPSKKKVEIPVKETPEGYVGQIVPTEVGPHKVDVTYGSAVVPKSPFPVEVTPASVDLSKVKVTGLDTRKLSVLCICSWICMMTR